MQNEIIVTINVTKERNHGIQPVCCGQMINGEKIKFTEQTERRQSINGTNEAMAALNAFRGETKEQSEAAVEGH